MGYGGSIVIPNAWRRRSAESKPSAPRVRVPPTDAEIREAEDFLIGQLIGGPLDARLVELNRAKRKIRPSALTAATKRLAIKTVPTDWRRERSKTVPLAWDRSLPDEPTVAGARALIRYRERQHSWRQAQP